MKKRIAVLVSGGGTNLQALLEAEAAGKIPHGEISLVISSNPGAYALERARNFGVPAGVVSRKELGSQAAFEAELQAVLERNGTDLIILAGGHVPTQNRYFQEINLKSLLKNYQGVILGISAGTMNSAETVAVSSP